MSDKQRVLEALQAAFPAGVRSLDMRRRGLTGNPSERIRELRAEGYSITSTPYAEGRRQGRIYTLVQGTAEPTAYGVRASGGPLSKEALGAGEAPVAPLTEEEPAGSGQRAAPGVLFDMSDFAPTRRRYGNEEAA